MSAAGLAQPTGTSVPTAPARDPLSRYLHDLADNPHSLAALTGAGRAALDMGDPQAALTFFARAENEAPRDGRVKALMGAALVQLEQPRAAMKFFGDAAQLGYAEADFAGDRGLAWDISGDPRRAQRDYRLALTRGANPEVSRRLALSLAIGGDREGALRQLQEQLATGDRAAERTRALVLALTGDTAGADRAVQAAMPGAAGQAMMPFLARLPQLSYADRALAVHLGHFPGNASGVRPAPNAYAANDFASSVQRGPTDAGRPDSGAPSLARLVAAAPAQPEPARSRPVQTQAVSSATANRAVPPHAAQPAATAPRRLAQGSAGESEWSWSRGGGANTLRARAQPKPAAPSTATRPTQIAASSTPPPKPASLAQATPAPAAASAREAEPQAQPGSSSVIELPAGQTVSIARNDRPAARPPAPAPPRNSSRLAALEATVEEIADPVHQGELAPPVHAPSARPSRTAAATRLAANDPATAKLDPKKKPEPKKPEPKPEPSRAWVQIAVAGEKSALPREFSRLQGKAPKLLAARAPWTAPMGNTNRLLVGPFPSPKEAQAFVRDLAKLDLGGFAWTSDEGEKVQKLSAR
jgi:Flp pilus assembly protein TadD